jgi:TPR repeat protein
VFLYAAQAVADTYDEAVEALTEADYFEAYRSFQRLAKRGHAQAQYQLGMLYLYGKGVGQDVQQGISWLKQAAEGYSYLAANELSQIYLSGQWVKRDEAEAVKWLELSNKIAAQNVGEAEDGCD